nr:LytTR family DNA-binding domain-containing protein [Lysinibacillus timonensis]
MRIENLKVSKSVLEQFQTILEDWIPKQASIVIALDNKYIYLDQNMLHHSKVNIGDEISPNGIASKVLQLRMKTDVMIDESIFGSPYYAIGYPTYIDQHEAALIILMPINMEVPKKPAPYKFLTGKHNEDWAPIPIEEISHIESLQKRTWFYANNCQFKTNCTLKELQTKLPEFFIRVHRSYILNIYFIKRITKDIASNYIIILKNGDELPVSQSYINDLRKVLEF